VRLGDAVEIRVGFVVQTRLEQRAAPGARDAVHDRPVEIRQEHDRVVTGSALRDGACEFARADRLAKERVLIVAIEWRDATL